MNWGKSIILSFVLFAIFIGVLVTVCVRQEVSLVSKEYYKEELDFQHQMDRERNTDALVVKPEIRLTENHALQVTFALFDQFEKGKLVLYSPGDARQDKTFALTNASAADQTFSLSDFKKGKYIARMTWTMRGQDYYYETVVIL
ncbi:FixH family protein [Chryseolinea lacunae]|uniref:FixH family protein n=1 Tax=Chryseolinea lacunae TaxID=2801331 RepID=A0ABS1KM26_9BACT|nr:FixH family protein [Chryseolinea lacunae]MBL0740501.1 FixH family protein [Chryseolinea lacunae]